MTTVFVLFGVVIAGFAQESVPDSNRPLEPKVSPLQSTSVDTKSNSDALADAEKALAESRYADAAALYSTWLNQLDQNSDSKLSADAVAAKQQRIARLARFIQLADYGHELVIFGRIAESLTVFGQSLDVVGVWESGEWWDNLPTQDLTPHQRDEFRWDVYRALIGLDGLLVLRMGTALGPLDGGAAGALTLARRYLMTDAGFNESNAALEVSRRIKAYRPSQAARWYSATSKFRLHQGHRMKASELGPPENAADGYGLAILSLLTHVEPNFQFWFSGYGKFLASKDGQLPTTLDAMQETLARSAENAPNHYWTHLLLSHSQYWLAEIEAIDGNPRAAIKQFARAQKSLNRCIVLRADAPFAYSDRSTLFRSQAEVLRSIPGASQADLDRANQLMQSSLDDAQTGRRLAPTADWVYWHEGLTLVEMRQSSEAAVCFLKAAQLGMNFGLSTEGLRVRVDDLRGRTEAISFAESMLDESPSLMEYRSLLAALHISRNDLELASQHAAKVIAEHPYDAVANAVAGWCHIRCGESEHAVAPLSIALEQDPNSVWMLMGLARAALETGDLVTALEMYERVIDAENSPKQQASAWLGIAQVRWKQSANSQAINAAGRARELDVACDLNDLAERAVLDWRALQTANKVANETEHTEIEAKADSIKRFLEELSEMPIGSAKSLLEKIGKRAPIE